MSRDRRLLDRLARGGWRRLERLTLAWRPHGVALLYHRVAEIPTDPFGLAVTPEHFAQHMAVLRDLGPCLPFDAFARRLAANEGGRRAFCVTFDDGYRDNLTNAAPILAAAGVPATVFVVSGMVGANRMFWWDALQRILLTPGALPETLDLTLRGETRRWSLGAARFYEAREARANAGWSALSEPPRDARQTLMFDLWKWLVTAPTDEAERLADALAAWSGVARSAFPEDHPMTADALNRLAAVEGIEIGGHTVTHPRLTQLPPESQLAEIRDSRLQLQAMTGREIRSFAYPYGSESAETAQLAAAAGYVAACTTRQNVATARSDPLRIPRLVARDWDGDEFARQIRRLTSFLPQGRFAGISR